MGKDRRTGKGEREDDCRKGEMGKREDLEEREAGRGKAEEHQIGEREKEQRNMNENESYGGRSKKAAKIEEDKIWEGQRAENEATEERRIGVEDDCCEAIEHQARENGLENENGRRGGVELDIGNPRLECHGKRWGSNHHQNKECVS